MKIKLANRQTGHLMTDLGISSERCVVLCQSIRNALVELHNEGKDTITVAEVTAKAIEMTNAKDINEIVFISITSGEYHAEYVNDTKNMMSDVLSSFEPLIRRSSVLS